MMRLSFFTTRMDTLNWPAIVGISLAAWAG